MRAKREVKCFVLKMSLIICDFSLKIGDTSFNLFIYESE